MADLNFPLNPQVNDTYTFNSRTFKYDGSKWRYVSLSLITITSGSAITSLNSLTNSAQDFFVGVSGSGFNISSVGSSHTFNIPFAGSASTGLITTASQTIAGSKTFSSDLVVSSSTASTNTTSGALTITGGAAFGDSINVAGRLNFWNGSSYSSFVSSASGNTVYTLPSSSPATGTSVLQSTSAGVMSWVPMTATGAASGFTTLNTLTSGIQYFSVGTSGSGFNISSSGSTHTFNIPIAGSGSTGLITTASQTVSGQKTFTSTIIGDISGTATTAGFATTAANVNLVSAITNTSHPIIFSPSSSGSGVALSSNTAISFNPSTNILSTSGLAVTAGTSSTSTSSGALIVTGGVGIGGTLFVGTTISVNSGTSGLLLQKLVGGNYGAIYSTGITPSATNYTMITDGAAVNFNGTGGVYFNISNSNKIQVTTNNINIVPTAASTSASTGSLTVAGGVGIGGSLYVASATAISGITINNGIITGSLTGTATTAQNINVADATSNSAHFIHFSPSATGSGLATSTNTTLSYNPSTFTLSTSGISITSSTASTSTTTGSFIATGGVGIGQSVSVGGRLQLFNGANYTAFVSSATGNTVYTLPATSPATGSSVLQSTAAGVLSWVPLTASGGVAVSGGTDGMVQYKVGSGLGATSSLFFDTALLGLRISGFPGGNTPSSTDAVLKLESTIGSFNGSVNGTYIAVNAPTGFAGDLMNLEVNAVSKFKIDNTGAVIQNIGTNSTSTTSGAVQIKGGVGITGAIFVGESINATSTTTSTSTSTGSLVVSGGAGFAGTINVGGTAKIFASTASTNTWTGALLVGGGVGISGQLTFAQASLGYTGITSNPSMSFIGNTSSSPITLTVLTDNSINFEGSQGSVFSIDSNLSSGEIFAVSDISGLPIISASAGQTVNINEFGGYTQFGNGTINSSSTSTGAVVIAGGLGMTGNANFGGTVLISNSTLPGYGSTTSGALVVSGGVGIGGSVYIGGQLGVGGTLDYNASGNVSFFAGNVNSYNQVIVHNHNAGNNASSDFVVSNDSTTDTTYYGDFGMNSSGWAATTSAFNTANAVYLASNSGDLAIGSLTANPIRFFYNNGTSDAVVVGGTAATIYYGTNSTSTTSGALQVKGGLGITGNAFIGGTTSITNTTASTSTSSGALTVSGGAGIGQTLFVGGSISNANCFYSGGNNFTKSGQAQGDILLDNNANDTPGILYYYKNNTNFGTDVFATGTGSTRYRIVKDLNESGGSELWSIDRTGVVTRSAWDVGEVINTRVYNNSDLGMSATTTINSTTYTNIAVITYTPKSSTSHLWIEFDANYDYSNGTTTDDFFSRITVAGSVISERNQIMVGQVGGGTRSGVIFPISGRYTNSSTSGIAITVQARWGSADDAIRVYGSSTSGYMRIQEIGR